MTMMMMMIIWKSDVMKIRLRMIMPFIITLA